MSSMQAVDDREVNPYLIHSATIVEKIREADAVLRTPAGNWRDQTEGLLDGLPLLGALGWKSAGDPFQVFGFECFVVLGNALRLAAPRLARQP